MSEESPQFLQCSSLKTMKWMYCLLYFWLFLGFFVFCCQYAQAEKLTQEQVLEELGVKIKSKGKHSFTIGYLSVFQRNVHFWFLYSILAEYLWNSIFLICKNGILFKVVGMSPFLFIFPKVVKCILKQAKKTSNFCAQTTNVHILR